MMTRLMRVLFVGLIASLALPVSAAIDFDDLDLLDWRPIPGDYGSTADIGVSYRSTLSDGSDPVDYIQFWNNDYSDLHKVAFGHYSPGIAEITFTSLDSGRVVRLNSFDLGSWPNANRTAAILRVMNGSGAELWTMPDTFISGSVATHFTPDVAAPQLVPQWGYDYNIGVDNIDVTSEVRGDVIPVPAALPLLGMGLAGLATLRRRFW